MYETWLLDHGINVILSLYPCARHIQITCQQIFLIPISLRIKYVQFTHQFHASNVCVKYKKTKLSKT